MTHHPAATTASHPHASAVEPTAAAVEPTAAAMETTTTAAVPAASATLCEGRWRTAEQYDCTACSHQHS
jgi:hypothetical protein